MGVLYARVSGAWVPVATSSGIDQATADARYVNIDGDTMTGDLVIATPAGLSFGSALRQMLNLYGAAYALGVQSSTLYQRTGLNFAWYRGGVHSATTYDPGAGGVEMMSLAAGGLDIGKDLGSGRILGLFGSADGLSCYQGFYSGGSGQPRLGWIGYSANINLALVNEQTNGVVLIQAGPNGSVVVRNTATELGRFINSGDLLVGKTAADLTVVGLEVKGALGRLYTTTDVATGLNHVANINSATAGSVFESFRRSNTQIGSITASSTSAVAFNQASDRRLKNILGPVDQAADRLKRLKVWHFAWKQDGIEQDGLIADEVQEVVPIAVTGEPDAVDEDGEIVVQQMDYSKLVPLLVAAVQEQQRTIEALEQRITQLEAA